MVEPPVLAGALDGNDVLGLLDDADDALVAAGVAADGALGGLGDVAAGLAEADLGLDGAQGLDEALDGGRVGGQDVEGHALGGLGADAGQLAELVDEVLDGAFVDGGHVSVPPGSR